eukprot:jgi/Botrbrau1/14279/Bobra.0368s0011.1
MNQRTPESARAKLPFPQPLSIQDSKPKGGRPKTFIHDHFIQDGVYNERAKRTGVSCRYCTFKTANSKVSVLVHHILESCPSVPRNVKDEVDEKAKALATKQAQASQEGQPAEVQSGVKRKVEASIERSAPKSSSLDSKAEETLDLRAVRFIVLCGCSFSILDSPWFYDFVTMLRPNYKPPGLAQLPGLLLQEYRNVVDRVTKLLASASGITVVFDRRLHAPSRVTYHTTCITEHGDVLPGPWKEVPTEAFDAALVAGFMDDAVRTVGAQKIIAVTTDTSTLNVLASRDIVCQMNYKHMLTLSCAVHGFTVLTGACLGHSWARSLLVKAQVLMIYIHSSPDIRAMLQPSSLLPPDGSRDGVLFSLSFLEYTVTNLINMEQAVKITLLLPNINCRADIQDLVNDAELWQGLKVLQPLLLAVSKVLSAVKKAGRRALLSDMTRYFLFIARHVEQLSAFVPQEYAAAVSACVMKRMPLHDGPLQRLAVFLDPSFRSIVGDSMGLVSLLQQAGVLLQNRKGDEQGMRRLIAEMQAYKAGTSPFEVPYLGGCDVRNWWLNIQLDKAPELVAIARQISAACPVSGLLDDVFQKAGWRLPPVPLCPPGIDPAVVDCLHTFHSSKAPRMDNPRNTQVPPIQGATPGDELMVMSPTDLDASLGALYSYWDEDSQQLEGLDEMPAAEGSSNEQSSFVQLLLGPWEKVPLDLLDPDFEPPSSARQAILPDLPAHAPAAWDVNTVLQQYMGS